MAERALSEHLDSLVLIHGARRNQLQRGTSCLAIILSGAAAWSEDVAVEVADVLEERFRGSGAYPGWMPQSDVLERSLGARTVVRATAMCAVLAQTKG